MGADMNFLLSSLLSMFLFVFISYMLSFFFLVFLFVVISYMCFFLLSNQCRRCLKGDTYRGFLVPTDFLFNGGWIARTVYFNKTCLIIFIFLINVKIFSICFSGS